MKNIIPLNSKIKKEKEMELIKSYTEENYSMEELIQIMVKEMRNSRKQGLYVEFITQKPIYNKNGEIINITTDFPAELNIYKNNKKEKQYV